MAPDPRERGKELLSTLTLWVGGVSVGLVGAFAGVAAATIPGTAASSASAAAAPADSTTTTNPGDETSTEPVQVQPPVYAPIAAPPDQPHARSGGSSHR
jgi:hypothetical protein